MAAKPNGKAAVAAEEKVDGAEKAAPNTCFIIMPISDHPEYPKGHFTEVYRYFIRPTVEEAGFTCIRADDFGASHLIQLEIVRQAISADLCICDLSSRNPNVLFELGIRQAFDKPTVLLKDQKTPETFDINGFRYVSYDHELRIGAITDAKNQLRKAIDDTMGAHGENDQVFSLVSMLALKEAASLQKANVDPENAQLQILDRKIDTLQRMVQSIAESSFSGSGPAASDGSSRMWKPMAQRNGAVRLVDTVSDRKARELRNALIEELTETVSDQANFGSLSILQMKNGIVYLLENSTKETQSFVDGKDAIASPLLNQLPDRERMGAVAWLRSKGNF
jgi:hypothetical protein